MIDIKVLASSSKGNCYKIDDGSSSLLIEAGIPIRKIKEGLNFKLYEIEGCFITHEHKDHSKSVIDLAERGIDIYLSEGTYDNLGYEEFEISTFMNLNIIDSRELITCGSWIIQAFDVEHDSVEPLGFIFYSIKTKEKVLYLTDTYYSKYTFPKMDYMMIECNHSYKILDENVAAGRLHPAQKRRLIQSHMALENVEEMLKVNDLSKVKEIYLIHLSDMNSNAELFKRKIKELTGKPVYIGGE